MAEPGAGDGEEVVKEGDHVVLRRGEIYKAVQIQKKKKVVFEKQWFFLDGAVGQLYGTTFEVSGGALQPRKPNTLDSSTDSREAGADNRNIVDDGKSQKLTRDDIQTLKEQGLLGQEIVQQLVENSTTFRDKTEFAQEKYIKKKKKKYESSVTVLKPSGRILAMMYHGREPGKVLHLRYDTLAQMLTLGNVHAGSKLLVMETCAGLVLGAVMERMGGYGSVVQLYPGGGPVRAGMESFGFPAHFHHTLHSFPVCQLNALLAGTLDTAGSDPAPADIDPASTATDPAHTATDPASTATDPAHSGEVPANGGLGEFSDPARTEPARTEPARTDTDRKSGPAEVCITEGSTSTEPAKEEEELEMRRELRAQEKKVKTEEKRQKLAAATALLEGRNFDGLVVASRFHPCAVLMVLLKFLAPSRPFVVYSQFKEPLIECYTKLREQGGTVNLRLTDSWLRHYQVLPNRTHPILLMSGGGGYLLTGTTVAMDTPKPQKAQKHEVPQMAEEPAAKRAKLTD